MRKSGEARLEDKLERGTWRPSAPNEFAPKADSTPTWASHAQIPKAGTHGPLRLGCPFAFLRLEDNFEAGAPPRPLLPLLLRTAALRARDRGNVHLQKTRPPRTETSKRGG